MVQAQLIAEQECRERAVAMDGERGSGRRRRRTGGPESDCCEAPRSAPQKALFIEELFLDRAVEADALVLAMRRNRQRARCHVEGNVMWQVAPSFHDPWLQTCLPETKPSCPGNAIFSDRNTVDI